MRKTMQFLKNMVGVGEAEDNFVAEIKAEIPGFEAEDFLAWVEDRFGKFQKSWSKGAIEELHPFETEQLYEMQKMYFEEAREKGIAIKADAVSVKSLGINNFTNNKDKYEIGVCLQANARKSSNNADLVGPSYYYLVFEKEKYSNLATCPSCTAPVMANVMSCDYCHTKFPLAMDRWKLAKIDME